MFGLFPTVVTLTHFHLFCGLGGGAVGFNKGSARVGNLRAEMRCVGGIDSDPHAIADFNRLTGARGTVLDLFSREQYEAWHGCPPPAGWVEATPEDIRAAVEGGLTPDMAFLSAPCKGFSGLQNPTRAQTRQYQALNELTVRGFWLLLQAFAHDPIPLIILENVPRIANSGPHLLDQIDALLECAGYHVAHTVHDAGEIGGLGQKRKRFLLVARHRSKVPPFLYEAPRKRLRSVGEVLSEMPLPNNGSRIHKLPSIEWLTWTRLALVEAGKDWRSLRDLKIGPDGMVEGLRLVHERVSVVEDPRLEEKASSRTGRPNEYGQLGVLDWQDTGHTVTGQAAHGAGWFSVADPRVGNGWGGKGKGRITGWDEQTGTVIAASHAATGAFAVQDPRLNCTKPRYNDVYHVMRWSEASNCVTGANGNARPNIQDPRILAWANGRASFEGGGHYGVARADLPSGAVVAHAKHDRGFWSVADDRVPAYAAKHRLEEAPLIIALDGTFHRPFTTLELAALQGFEWELLLDGLACRNPKKGADGAWRERIGNAVPPPAAQAIASTMAETLLMARASISVNLNNTPIWVRPLATALSFEGAHA